MSIQKILLILLSIFCFSNCSITVPYQTIIVNSPYKDGYALEALQAFGDLWEETFEQDIWYYLDHLKITFVPKTEEKWWTPGCVRGQTYDERNIRIAYIEDPIPSLGQTALFHELVHIALWNLYEDPDYDHTGPYLGLWTQKHEQLIADLKARYSMTSEEILALAHKHMDTLSPTDERFSKTVKVQYDFGTTWFESAYVFTIEDITFITTMDQMTTMIPSETAEVSVYNMCLEIPEITE